METPKDKKEHHEQELRERYRIISELTSDFAYSFLVGEDKTLTYEWSTEAINRTTGYTVEEILQAGWQKVIHPDDLKLIHKRLDALLDGRTDITEFRIITKNGQLRWVRSYGYPMLDEQQKKVVRIYGAAQDITARRLALEALQISQERFHALAEAAFEGILIIDKGAILDTNSQCADIFGYSTKQMTGMGIAKLFKTENSINPVQILSSNSQDHFECRAVCRTGSVIELEIRSRLFPYKGRWVSMTAVRDITERKKAENELVQSQERYKRLVGAVTAYTYLVEVYDGKAVSTRHSPGCIAITGYRPEDYEANPSLWHSMIHNEDMPEVERTVREVMSGKTPLPVEHRIRKKSGREVWVRNTIVPHRNDRGDLLRYDGLIEDITERKKAEVALKESQERYKRLVSAVTAYTYSVELKDGKAFSTRHSPGCIAITGYRPEDYKSNPDLWRSMIHHEDVGKVEGMVQQLMSGKTPLPVEHRIQRNCGRQVWVRNTIVPHRNDRGHLLRYDGLIEDITERKKAETEKEDLIGELQNALSKVKTLSGLIPICASCKKIRDDKGYWQQIELYIKNHSEADFSHGICPDCFQKLYPEIYNKQS